MRFYNATLEQKDWLCDSFQFSFKPRSVLKIPDRLGHIAIEDLKNDGIFCIDEMNDESFHNEEREALIRYLRGNLRFRIHNFEAYYEELRKAGTPFEKTDPLYLKLIRWEKELSYKLNAQKPINVEMSYLSKEEREKLGITTEGVIGFEDEKEIEKLKSMGLYENLFEGFGSRQVVDLAAPKEYMPPASHVGSSFSDIEFSGEVKGKKGRSKQLAMEA